VTKLRKHTPRIFNVCRWGGEPKPEAIYNLFDFKNYVTKIMS